MTDIETLKEQLERLNSDSDEDEKENENDNKDTKTDVVVTHE